MRSTLLAHTADGKSELRFDRTKNGQTITVIIEIEAEGLTITVGPDDRVEAPAASMTCSLDQWHALRFAAEWYFHALDELESK